ncbi:MAG TPA: molybdopterin-dependent oxidoreductase, partial [Thermoanaerobaculia bacterium]|nr:molybdopterin-dependent oxidoreductase [Thermoanaerobaculia bacterium]
MPGLGTSFGRGGATTAQQDLANADAILIMGSSMAENHPVGFQWVVEARETNGAKIIHVDPRFTRTSAMADHWVPLRAGSDLVFLGALIRYTLENERYFRDYVVRYTNAPTILREDFQDTEDLDGFFSGWDGKKYDPTTWLYEGAQPKDDAPGHRPSGGGHGKDRGGEAQNVHKPIRDESLQNPRCVFQVLKRHFSRYTPELVERLCGVPKERFLEIADVYTSASGPEKTAAICYAVGWTQHSTGVQIIRAAAILQLLLGNIGRPGGGIMALRGHASIQGSTDIPTLYDILPGYLPMPALDDKESQSLSEYIKKHKSPKGWWYNIDKYIVSLLKSYYGDAATRENDFGFDWLPRLTGDHSHFGYWTEMQDGKLDGLFIMGQNPAVGAPNGKFERTALGKLKWLVVRDMVENESATFWKDSPEVVSGEIDPEELGTEVFFFPAASHVEKAGTFTNTQRLLQWREKAVEPPGACLSDLQFMIELGRKMKQRATDSPRDAGLRALTWNYADDDSDAVLREIQGNVKTFADLKTDGSTACGCWIYSGVYDGENKALKREPKGRYGHGWGYAWPLDRRILYNRCSARPDGAPWSERKKLVWWDEAKGEWTGDDVPDFTKKKRPDYPGDEEQGGDEALPGDAPFIMHPDGAGWIWVPSGLKDGPLPAFYEPLESNVANPLYEQQTNPAANKMERADNRYASSPDPRFPYILTTYRLTEHHTAGGMSRTLSHLAELQPELFAEISPELAAAAGVANGDRVKISTARGSIEARALVTDRMPSLDVDGTRVHQVGLPYHFGYRGLVKGDIVNDLLAISEEPNVRIFESKGLTCSL